jgi:hypothetical protein
LVEQQTRVRESTAGDERRLHRLRTRYRTLLAFAVGLLAIGLVLTVTAFALVLRGSDDEPRGTTLVRQVADQLARAGVGCEDFDGAQPSAKAIAQEARCTTKFGPLRIVVYRSPQALNALQAITLGYQCLAAAWRGETKLVSVFNGLVRLALPDDNLTAAQAYRRAYGGKVETTDCTAAPPTTAAPPVEPPAEPTPEPAPEPEPTPEPAPQ